MNNLDFIDELRFLLAMLEEDTLALPSHYIFILYVQNDELGEGLYEQTNV